MITEDLVHDALTRHAGGAADASSGDAEDLLRRCDRRVRRTQRLRVATGATLVLALLTGTAALWPGDGGSDVVTVAGQGTKPPREGGALAEKAPADPGEKPPAEPVTKEPVVVPTTAADKEPPTLVVLSPAKGLVTEAKAVTAQGRTEPGAKVAVGTTKVAVAPDGSWSAPLPLVVGQNRFKFAATDAAGNARMVELTVQRTEPKPPPTTVPKPTTTTAPVKEQPTEKTSTVAFTAVQVSASGDASPPYAVFSGTAAPGSKVKVLSPWGYVYDLASPAGTWEIRAEFPEAAVGKTFTVKAYSAETGEYVAFTFTRTG